MQKLAVSASRRPNPFSFSRTAKVGGRTPLLDVETERQLIARWQNHSDAKALERIVASFQILVAKIAMRYRASGLPMEDLMSEGNVGLLHAIGKFDPQRGCRLSTYAMWWIHAAISDYSLATSSIVRGVTTERQKRVFFALRRLKSRLSCAEEEGSQSTYVEMVAETLGVDPADVADIDNWMESRDVSYNAAPEFEEGPGEEWQDLLADDAADPELDFLEADEESKQRGFMHEAIGSLDDRERLIVRERHLTDPPSKLADIGVQLGITRERVRQLETRALEKLRRRVREIARGHGLDHEIPLARRPAQGVFRRRGSGAEGTAGPANQPVAA